MEVALGSVELKSRNIKGLMAELDTMDTPMMAWRVWRNFIVDNQDLFSHLHCPTPGHGAPGVSQDLLPDELVHHVGQVCNDEGDYHCQGHICGFHFGSGEITSIRAFG